MAVYHFTVAAVSQGKGQSVVAKAAYNARVSLYDEHLGKTTRDYGTRGGLAWAGIFAPTGAPDWVFDREQLWNNAVLAERQKNAQPARNVEFALPNELTRDEQIMLVTDFCRENFSRKGMVADVVIHSDYDFNGELIDPTKSEETRNDHVHALVTMRRLHGDHFSATKTDAREWNSREQLSTWRSNWARLGANYLERAGFTEESQRFSVGHLSLSKQLEAALERGDFEFAESLDRSPTRHRGPAVDAMEARGIVTRRLEYMNELNEIYALKDYGRGEDYVSQTQAAMRDFQRREEVNTKVYELGFDELSDAQKARYERSEAGYSIEDKTFGQIAGRGGRNREQDDG